MDARGTTQFIEAVDQVLSNRIPFIQEEAKKAQLKKDEELQIITDAKKADAVLK